MVALRVSTDRWGMTQALGRYVPVENVPELAA
jgi:hypothetical protein